MNAQEAVIQEALSWVGTAFHMNACVKINGDDKGGVDCGRFLIAVYSAVGVMPPFDPGTYSPQFHLNRNDERYMSDILKFAREVEGPPKRADVALFHIGRVYAHGAIVVDWPQIVIHAPSGQIPGGVQTGSALQEAMLVRQAHKFPPKFFRPLVWD